jgi:hypothetical protein
MAHALSSGAIFMPPQKQVDNVARAIYDQFLKLRS